MNPISPPDNPTHYRFLIGGHLSSGWSAWFDGLGVATSYDEDGRPLTTLAGTVQDQAELHGIIARIRDLGLPLLLVEQGDPSPQADDDEPAADPD